VTWNLVFSRYALKDAKKLSAAGLREKAQILLDILEVDPLQNPPPFEKLVGDLKGAYSRRINIQHRLVYEIFRKEKIVRVLRMWTHYDWGSTRYWARSLSSLQTLCVPCLECIWLDQEYLVRCHAHDWLKPGLASHKRLPRPCAAL